MELSEKAKQQFKDYPEHSPKEKAGNTTPLTMYPSPDLESVVVLAPGVEPELNTQLSEEQLREFKQRVEARASDYCGGYFYTPEVMEEFDESIVINQPGEPTLESQEFYKGVESRLTKLVYPHPLYEGCISKLDMEISEIMEGIDTQVTKIQEMVITTPDKIQGVIEDIFDPGIAEDEIGEILNPPSEVQTLGVSIEEEEDK